MLCYGYLNYLFIYDVGLGREQVADCGSHFPATVLIDCRENKPPPQKKGQQKNPNANPWIVTYVSRCRRLTGTLVLANATQSQFGVTNCLVNVCQVEAFSRQSKGQDGWMDGYEHGWLLGWMDGWMDGAVVLGVERFPQKQVPRWQVKWRTSGRELGSRECQTENWNRERRNENFWFCSSLRNCDRSKMHINKSMP